MTHEENTIRQPAENQSGYTAEKPPVLRLPKSVSAHGKIYTPAGVIAKEFGYTWGHLSLLSRSGKIDSVQVNGKWFVNRPSVVQHRETAQKNRVNSGLRRQGRVPLTEFPTSGRCPTPGTEIVPLLPLIEEHLSRRANPARTAIALGVSGLLIFYFVLAGSPTFELDYKGGNMSSGTNFHRMVSASLWDDIKNLFRVPEVEIYLTTEQWDILIKRIRNLEAQSQPQIVQVPGTETTIIREIVSGPSNILLSRFEERLGAVESYVSSSGDIVASFQSRLAEVERLRPAIVMPAYFGTDTPKLALGSDSVSTNTLTVLESASIKNLSATGSATLTTLTVSGNATIDGTLTVDGNIGIGTTLAPNQLTVVGSGSFTGRLDLSRSPLAPHTGTWPDFTNLTDATLYMNPVSPVADGNIIVYSNNGAAKFVVDAEGDIYGNNLILQGSTTTGTTTIAGDLSVEGNTTFGDAVGDRIYFVGTILPKTLTSNLFTIQASPSWDGDYYIRLLDSSSNSVFHVASTSVGYFSGNVGIGTTDPAPYLLNVNSQSGNALGIVKTISATSKAQIGVTTTGAFTLTQYGVSFGGTYAGISLNNVSILESTGSNTIISYDLGSLIFVNGVSETMRVTSAGNVGIGTTGPGDKLHVSGGGILLDNAQAISFKDTTGIAQTAVIYDAANNLVVRNNSTTGHTYLGVNAVGNGVVFFQTQGQNRMVLDENGNVGIGTTVNVDAKLEVAGTASISNSFYVTSGGNVGIGTTIPNTELEVVRNNSGATTAIRVDNSNTGTVARGSLQLKTGNSANVWNFAANAGNLLFGKVGADYGAILDGGNFGIGTTNPTSLLHVKSAVGAVQQIENTGTASRAELNVATETSGTARRFILRAYGAAGSVSPTKFGISSAPLLLLEASGSAPFAIGTGDASVLVLGTNNVERLRVDSTGNVGIGTTLPTQQLEVSGNVKVNVGRLELDNFKQLDFKNTAGTQGYGQIFVDNATGAYAGADGMAFFLNGQGRMAIKSDGNVGVGSSSPDSKLDVTGNILASSSGNIDLTLNSTTNQDSKFTLRNVGATARLDILGSASQAFLSIASSGNVGIGTTVPGFKQSFGANITPKTLALFESGGSDFYGFGIDTSGTARMTFYTANTEFMAITNTGNVGIGTTSPGRLLHLRSTVSGEYPLRVDGVQGTIELQDSGTTRGYVTTAASFFNTGGLANGLLLRSEGVGIQFAPGGSGTSVSVTMASGGNVGIGTTTPQGKLHVNTGTNQNLLLRGNTGELLAEAVNDANNNIVPFSISASSISFQTGGFERVRIKSDGNVGIGTTAPGDLLNVYGDSKRLLMQTATAGGNTGVKFQSATGSLYLSEISHDTGNLIFKTTQNGTLANRMFINGLDGRVGIGTTGPGAKLHLDGAGSTTLLISSTDNNPGIILKHGSGGAANPNIEFQNESAARLAFIQANGATLLMYGGSTLGISINAAGQVAIPNVANCNPIKADGNGTLNCSSDEQLKNISGNYDGGLSVINAISPVLYTWKENSGFVSSQAVLGFSAQNVQAVIPEAVTTDPNGYLQLNEFSILAAAVNAIQELDLKIEYLEQQPLSGEFENIGESPLTLASILDAVRSLLADGTLTLVSAMRGVFDTVEAKQGVTIYDRVTGQPYCIGVENGQTVTTPGNCDGQPKPAPEATPEPSPELTTSDGATTSDVTEPTPEPELTTEEVEITEPIPYPESITEPPPDSEQETPLEPASSPTPEPEYNPEPEEESST